MSEPTFTGTKGNPILKSLANKARSIYKGSIAGSNPDVVKNNSARIAFYAAKCLQGYKGSKKQLIPTLYSGIGKYLKLETLTAEQLRVKGAEFLLAVIDVGEQYSAQLAMVRSFR